MKAICNFVQKKDQYMVYDKRLQNMDSTKDAMCFDNQIVITDTDNHIFSVPTKPDIDCKLNANNSSVKKATKRLSIIKRVSDINSNENPFRRRMSFIKDTSPEESLIKTTIQILLASLCAGFGNVGAGVVLQIVTHWAVFIEIKEMFILVPSLLGLKGNLEMTMASRLSTEANLGHMNKWSTTLRMIGGDMALVQCQATVISFLAALVAIVVNVCQSGTFVFDNCLVICASSLITANVACFLLGLIMAVVIVFSNKINIDPDNIATPIAASVGDISTAALFALFAQWIHSSTRMRSTSIPILATLIIVLFVVLLPVFYIIARRNRFTHKLVHTGWTPVISAMIISSGGGLFLDSAVDRYDKLPPFQPVICGVGGNIVAVAASKISTSLHMNSTLGNLPFGVNRFSSPLRTFFNKRDVNTKLLLILLLMSIPLQILYAIVIWCIQRQRITLTASLILLYVSFASTQVLILLLICYNLVHILWSFAINPDNTSIPLLTALGDLLGSGFLLLVFVILEKTNDPNGIIMHNSNFTYNSTHLSTTLTF